MAPVNSTAASNNSSEVLKYKSELFCVDGIILPAWLPLHNVGTGIVVFRGLVYIVSLIYLFVGVAILADKFMASIEMITSKKKVVKVKDENGKIQTVVVRVWNETVANLTLMALGCSCPEILLSSIEIIGKGFEAGEMGPGSTVGSAAFNLFIIIGVCNWAIPDGQVRKVKRVSVFLVTAAWSIFAYLWLYLITAVMSPGVIEVWEALITFSFFPMTVLSAYVADRHVHIYDYISKTYRMGRNGVIVEMTTDETEVVQSEPNDRINGFKKFAEETENEEIRDFEDHRRAFIILLKNLRRKYPMLKSNQLELMATKELLNRGSKSKDFYQVVASKMLTGRVEQSTRHPKLNLTELFQEFHPSSSSPAVQPPNTDREITKVFFSPGHYTVMENVGQFDVTVVREDGDLERLVFVDYTTEDGEARAGRDFEASRGTICFEPGVTSQTISIKIIDDQLYEEDQHFYIRLLNIRSGNRFEYLCGKGEIAEDAYLTTIEIHGESAPSYSMTLDTAENFGDAAPPRYSVTAREILSALKSNKNLRRPSWFHYDESDGELSTGDDDVFVDALSQFDTNTIDDNNQVFHEIQENQVKCASEIGIRNDSMTLSPSQTTLVTSVSFSSGRFSLTKLAEGNTQKSVDRKRSVEFFSKRESSASNNENSDSEEDNGWNTHNPKRANDQTEEHAHLRLICPSMATVMILDDDHRGIFSLSERSVYLTETVGTHIMLIVRIGGSRGRVAINYRTEEGTAKPNRDYLHCQGELIFEDGETEKCVAIQIIGESLYEKNVLFYFTIGEPKSIKDGDSDESIDDLEELSMREYSQLSEQQRIALRGRAQLGEVTTTVVHLKESKQFKNTVDKMVSKANKSLKRGTSSWLQQFIDAVHMEEENEESVYNDTDRAATNRSTNKINKWKEYTSHGITVFWRLIFAIIPPECMGGGYPCFFSSVVCIGIMTALINDVASHLGCTVGLKDSVTALAFVSLGTSLPDLFASKVSAVQDEHADASISNVTGSNAVNVFLGIGVAWTLAAFHHSYNDTVFHVEAGTLAFSVTLYCVMAIIAVVLLIVRRCDAVGGELGGPMKYKLPTTFLLVGCFILYILLSSMEAYGIINGF